MGLSRALGAAVVTLVLVMGGATTAGAAPVPLSPLITDTDAPTKIRVGAPNVFIPLTVVTGDATWDHVYVILKNQRRYSYPYDPQGPSGPAEPGRPRVFKVVIDVEAEGLLEWGAHFWELRVADDPSPSAGITGARVDVEVRAHSMIGLATSRSGDMVTVRGSVRAFHSLESRYVPWSRQPVSVQRWTGTEWFQVAGATPDADGNLNTRVDVPTGTQLRLVVKDAPTVWGAVSSTVTG